MPIKMQRAEPGPQSIWPRGWSFVNRTKVRVVVTTNPWNPRGAGSEEGFPGLCRAGAQSC